MSRIPESNWKHFRIKSKSRRSKNRPGGLNNILVAATLELAVVPKCWLPADLLLFVEAAPDVRTAAELLAVPVSVQAVKGTPIL